MLQKAIGQEEALGPPTIKAIKVEVGQTLLLCSDGLTGELDDEKIRDIVLQFTEPKEAVSHLVQVAKTAGGKDNITVCLASI